MTNDIKVGLLRLQPWLLPGKRRTQSFLGMALSRSPDEHL
jgi:hypothetical protein